MRPTTRSRYVYLIILCGPVVVAPGIAAHLGGASLRVLAAVARFQLLVAGALLLTAPVSLALLARALWRRDWKTAGDFAIAFAVPWLVWLALLLSNEPGVAAAFSHVRTAHQ